MPPSQALSLQQCNVPMQGQANYQEKSIILSVMQQVRSTQIHQTFGPSLFTGTAKGDPTEVNWIGEYFHNDRPLMLGSIKGNIGLVVYASHFFHIVHHIMQPYGDFLFFGIAVQSSVHVPA